MPISLDRKKFAPGKRSEFGRNVSLKETRVSLIRGLGIHRNK